MDAQKLLTSLEEQVCCQACSQHSKDQNLLRTRCIKQNNSQQQLRRHYHCNERLVEPTERSQQDQKMVDALLEGLRYQPDKEEHSKDTPFESAREIVIKEIKKYKEKTVAMNQQIEMSLKHMELLQKTVDKYNKEIAQNEAIIKYFEECCQSSNTTQLLKLSDDIKMLKQSNAPDSQYELDNEVSGKRKDSGIHSRSSSMESSSDDVTTKVYDAIKTNSHQPLSHTRELMGSDCYQSKSSLSGTDPVLASHELVESPNTDNQPTSPVTEKSDGLHVSPTATWYTTASFLTKTVVKTKLKRATRGPQLVAETKVQAEALEWYDNETLIINSGDEGVRRYARSCQQLGQSFSDDSRCRTCLAISRPDNLAFSVDHKSTLEVYDLHVDKLLKRIQLPVGTYTSATVTDGKLVICDNQNECLRVYEINRSKLTQKKFKGTVVCNSDLRKPWSISSLADGIVVSCRPNDQPNYMFHMDLSGTVLWKYCSVLDPWGITADSEKRVFVCNRKLGEIFMFNSNTMAATTAITTERLGYGYEPIELAIWNDTLAVYMTNGKTKAVKLFDISSLQ